jgi:DNA-binding transcriptional LysR family regulator
MAQPAPLRSIELRQWRQFTTLAQELHFGHAAQRLNMTQPPLTQAIALLEKTLGVRLFDRTKRSVQLTATGRTLLPHALAVLQRAADLTTLAHSAAAGATGRLKLAFVSTVGFALLPQWVMAFRQDCPGVALELLEATGDVQLRALERGEMDAGFTLHGAGFAPAGLQRVLVASEPMVLALPQHHALARKKQLRLQDLWEAPLVTFPRRIAPSLHDAIFAMYHAAEQLPVVAQEAIQMQTIVNLVSAGLGVAWVPASVQQFQRPGVIYRSVQGGVPVCETSLVWVRSSPVLERFLAFSPGKTNLPKAPAVRAKASKTQKAP